METRSMKKKRLGENYDLPDDQKFDEFMENLRRSANIWDQEKLEKILQNNDIALTEEVTILSESDLNRK